MPSHFESYSTDAVQLKFVANTATLEKKCPAFAKIHVDSIRIHTDVQGALMYVISGNRILEAVYPCGEEFFESGMDMYVGGIGETIAILCIDPTAAGAGAYITFSGRIEFPEENKRRFPSTSGKSMGGQGVQPPVRATKPKIEKTMSSVISWFKKLRH